MATPFRIYVGDTAPSLTDTITVNSVAFDLTGSSVKFQAVASGSEPGAALFIDRAATIVTPAAGTVRFDWQAADTVAVATLDCWWLVTLPSTAKQSKPAGQVIVEPRSKPAGGLIDLTDVREFLQKPAEDTTQDALLEHLIYQVSATIKQHCNREYAPALTVAVAREFWFANRIINLAPYNYQAGTATLIQIDTQTASPSTLVVDTDVYELPKPTRDGVVDFLSLAPTVASSATGERRVTVTAKWGYLAIPENVRLAALKTIAYWFRQTTLNGRRDQADDDGQAPVVGGIPVDARTLLQFERRVPIA